MSLNSKKTKSYNRAKEKQESQYDEVVDYQEARAQHDYLFDEEMWDDCYPTMYEITWGRLLLVMGLLKIKTAKLLEQDWRW